VRDGCDALACSGSRNRGAKSLGSGRLTINGVSQRFIELTNEYKTNATDPDYVLLSSEEPAVDRYERDRDRPSPRAAAPEAVEAAPEEIPF
jgi:hypothetical protein